MAAYIAHLDGGVVGPPPGGVRGGRVPGQRGRGQQQAGQVGGGRYPVEQVEQVPVQDGVQVGTGRF